MKKYLIIILTFMAFINNVRALAEGYFIENDNYLVENGVNYSTNVLSYQGTNYYFLDPIAIGEYSSEPSNYYFDKNFNGTLPEVLKYRFVSDNELSNEKNLFFYRYLWESKYPERQFSFSKNDEWQNTRYEKFKSTMDELIKGPDFDEIIINTGDVKTIEYEYLKYYSLSSSAGLRVSYNGDKMNISSENAGEYIIVLSLKNNVLDNKYVTDGTNSLASELPLNKTYSIKVTIGDDIVVTPPNTLDLSGLKILLGIIILILIYSCKKH